MKPYASIVELIESLELEIQSITDTIKTLKQEPKSFNEQIIFKYIDKSRKKKTLLELFFIKTADDACI